MTFVSPDNCSDTAARPAARQAPIAPEDSWRRYDCAGDTSAEDALIRQCLPLVRTIVGSLAKTLPGHVMAEDLQGAGMVGLLHAIRRFDAKRGASFKTFACFRIRGSVLDELRQMDWVPRRIHEKARKIQNAHDKLEQSLGAPPSGQQVADTLGITLADYRNWSDEIRPAAFVCLDASSCDRTAGDATLSEAIADDSQEDPFEHASRSDLKALIARGLRQLPPAQQKVLTLYYHEELRLREIAEVLELTESRISQILKQAILGLRAFVKQQEAMAARTCKKRNGAFRFSPE
jgi:RNA polymerase sigma factor for flagellar operon FliA